LHIALYSADKVAENIKTYFSQGVRTKIYYISALISKLPTILSHSSTTKYLILFKLISSLLTKSNNLPGVPIIISGASSLRRLIYP